MRGTCLLVVLALQLVQSLLLPSLARSSSSHARAAPLAARSRMIFNLADDDNINGYRELGLPEDATYDAVMDAFMALSEMYSDDPERILTLELAKNKVLDERLKQRMSGNLAGAPSKISPFDERAKVRTPVMVIAKRVLQRSVKPFEVPTRAHVMSCVPLLGAMTTAMLVAPKVQLLGTILMTVNSGMLIYSRNTDPLATDDYGQVGEIRPMKRKPMALTVGILFGAYVLRVKSRTPLANFLGVTVKALSPLMVGGSLIFVTCFFKAHGVFDRDD
jgi:hypothetical protein